MIHSIPDLLTRNRWFCLAGFAVLMNAAFWMAARRESASAASPEAPPPVRFTAGREGVVTGRDRLEWTFVAPPDRKLPLGEWHLNGPIAIAPDLPGRFAWLAADRLVFEPAAGWPPHTEFTAELPPAWTPVDGSPRFAFASERLQMLSVRKLGLDAERRVTVQVRFSHPIASQADLSEFVFVATPDGHSVAYVRKPSADGAILVLETAPVAAARLRVDISRNLPPAQGSLGLESDVRKVLEIGEPFSLQGARAEAPAFGAPGMTLLFNQPLAENLTAGAVTVSPPVPFSLEHDTRRGLFGDFRESSVRLTGDFLPGETYAIQVHDTLCDVHGQPLKGVHEVTVTIPDRAPGLRLAGSGIYLSRHGAAEVVVQSVNLAGLEITLERLYANNLPYFVRQRAEARGRYSWPGSETRAFSGLSRQVAAESRIPIGPRNTAVDTPIRIRDLAGERGGVFLLSVRSGARRREQLVVLTDLAITARTAADGGLVWVTHLRDGSPAGNVRVRVLSEKHQPLAEGASDASGRFRWPRNPSGDASETPALVIAETDDDMTFLNLAEGRLAAPDETGGAPYPAGPYEAWLFSERNLFRPGDRLELAALVRDAALAPAPAVPVALRIRGADGKPWRTLNGTLDAWGAASFEAALPRHLRSGLYRAELLFPGQTTVLGSFAFRIQSFLPPRLRVTLTPPGDALHFPEKSRFRVRAEYLHGGAAAGLPLESMVLFEPRDFAPDGWAAYRFHDESRSFTPLREPLGEGRLDEAGAITLALPTGELPAPPSMLTATLAATVRDFDGRATSAFSEIPVHRYPRYVGLKTLPGQTPVETPLPIETVLLDPAGRLVTTNAALEMIVERISRTFRLERDAEGVGSYRSRETIRVTETRPLEVREGAGRTEWTPTRPGEFRITVADRTGGARAARRVRVTEGFGSGAPSAPNPARPLKLSLDETAPRIPGGTARLCVEAPFPGWALVTVEGPGLHAVRVRRMEQTAAVFDLPLPALPRGHGVFAAVTVVRALPPGAFPRPARAAGILRIPIDRPDARLALEWALPEAPLRPGTRSDIAVRVRDAEGRPASGAQVWMLAVDEAIASLGHYPPPDPSAGFFRNSRLDIRQSDPFHLLLPEWKEAPVKRFDAAPGGDMPARGMNRLNPFRARRYVPTAWWIGRFTADAQGVATASAQWPAFDGTLRLTAVATLGRAFGAGTESRICRHPLVLHSGLPRFLSRGDRAQVRIDLRNQEDRAQSVALNLETRGPLDAGDFERAADSAGSKEKGTLRVRIPAHGRRSVTVPVRAGDVPGVATWKLTARAGDRTVVESVELAVRPAAPRESRVRSGRLAAGERFEWPVETDWTMGPASAEITLSGAPAARLAPLLRGLLEYPYGCLEQTVSQAFPLLFLSAPEALLPDAVLTPEGVKTRIRMAAQRVLDMQRSNGGFAYWPRSDQGFAWGSVYAMHFLAEAKRRGYEIPSARLAAGVDFLYREVLDRGGSLENTPAAAVQRANAAYACRAVAAAGRPARNWMRTLRERADRLDPESRLHLAAAFAEDGDRRTALALLEPIPGEASEPSGPLAAAVLHSPLRRAALRAEVWQRQAPEHPRARTACRRLLEQLGRRRWLNTQEKAWSLMALSSLTAEPPAPASLRLVQGAHPREETLAPGESRRLTLDPADGERVLLENTGEREVWFQARVSGYSRTHAAAKPVGNDVLRVRRTWLDRDGKVLEKPEAALGDLLVARIEVTAASGRLDHLVLEDLLPAGLEPEESTQVLETLLPWVKQANSMAVRHVEIRDDRVLVFPAPVHGRRSWHYAVRAVTPGTYRAAPIAAESMYDGTLRARGPAAVFTVLE